MKRIVLIAAVLGTMVVMGNEAMAGHGHARRWARNHAWHHADLYDRAAQRAAVHYEAHHYPMTWWQHAHLHDSLNHEALHDRIEHYRAHAGHAYAPCYGHGHHGVYIGTPHVSFWFGQR